MIRFKLDELLKKNSKTRYWLTKNTGIDFNTLEKIMNNQVKAIHLTTIERICNIFDCDLTDFMVLEKNSGN